MGKNFEAFMGWMKKGECEGELRLAFLTARG